MKRTNNQQSINPRKTVPNFQIRLHKKDGDKPGKRVSLKSPSKVTINKVTTQRTLSESCNIMKRLSFIAVGVTCLLFQSAQAAPLFSDGFNYTVADNLGAGSTTPPWSLQSSTAAAQLSISSPNLTYSGLQDLGGNALTVNSGVGSVRGYAALSSSITSGSVYYSFLIDCTALPTANSYLTALTPTAAPGPGGTATDAIDLYARNLSTGWQLGLRTTGLSASYSGTQLALNTVYFGVLKYTFGATTPTAQLFLSPDPTGAEPGTASVTLTGTANVADISDVGFRAQATGVVGNYVFDNVMVGTTWADVTTAVPEPATFALAGLGMLGLVFARRMRR